MIKDQDGTAHGGQLQRCLKDRHIQLMAIGGAIGTGLFLGSAKGIQLAGPSILLSYVIGGILIYIMMRALGEMATEDPITGSFASYDYKYISPLMGFMTGWSYWFMWIISCMGEVTAIGIFIQFWWPDMPSWLTALICIVFLTGINLAAASLFGEFEFWFAMIKVITIIVMIIAGVSMMFTGLGNNGVPLGVTNLFAHGGFFPNGIWGSMQVLAWVAFSFLGIELIGVTAGEVKNPDQVIPKAVKKVFWRILIFYVGALAVILSLYPWPEIGTQGSPFVMTFAKLGIAAAASIINFVVVTAVASACSSGFYTTGRMVYSLALDGKAPKYFAHLSKSGVPVRGILFSVGCVLISVVLNYVVPEKAFGYIAAIAIFAGLFVWFVSIWSQINFRKTLSPEQIKNLKFPMWGFPYANYLVMAFFVFIVVVMCLDTDMRASVIVGIPWLVFLWLIHKFAYGTAANKSESINKGDL